MGYYKNLEIEMQVEEPDRVPEPKPATMHVAHQYHSSRFGRIRYERTMKLIERDELISKIIRRTGLVALVLLAIGGVALW
jgi:hypothetical protein